MSGPPPDWLAKALLVDSWTGIWIAAFGLAAQTVFMARMLVQWIASERAKRSIVPVAFWWLSLVGASMLLVYGVMRADIVIILAQSFGLVIYIRNLWLIRAEKVAALTK